MGNREWGTMQYRCCLFPRPDGTTDAKTRQSFVPYSSFPIPAPAPQSTYNELTDSPNAIRRIVSASSSATLSWRRSEEHTSELQSLIRISYAVLFLKKTTTHKHSNTC